MGNRNRSKRNRSKRRGHKSFRRKDRRLKSKSKNYSKRSKKNIKKSREKRKRNKHTRMRGGAAPTFGGKIAFEAAAIDIFEQREYDALEAGEMTIRGKGDKIGEGGQGQVFEFTMENRGATDTVAVKIMKREAHGDEQIEPYSTLVGKVLERDKKARQQKFLESVVREYGYQKELSTGPHSWYFPKVYNFFQMAQGETYGIVMDFLKPHYEGHLDLFQLLNAQLKEPTIIGDKGKVHYCLELARAISATHKMGIVHSDLKPENVVIADNGTARGQLKLIDFGISFEAGDEEGNHKIDCCGPGNGTSFFLSYEILSNITDTKTDTKPKVGVATDWWSYGVMVYELVMGPVSTINHPCLLVAEPPGTPESDFIYMGNEDVLTTMVKYWRKRSAANEITDNELKSYYSKYKTLMIDSEIIEINGKIEAAKIYLHMADRDGYDAPDGFGYFESELRIFLNKQGKELTPNIKKGVVSQFLKMKDPLKEWSKIFRSEKGEQVYIVAKAEGGKVTFPRIEDYTKKLSKHNEELRKAEEKREKTPLPTYEETLLLKLAFQFFVLDPKKRPFLCLDKGQMEAYDGTTDGVRAEALGEIVAELERIELRDKQIESSQ